MTYEGQIRQQLSVMLSAEQREFFGASKATGHPLEQYLIWSFLPSKRQAFIEVLDFDAFDDPTSKNTIGDIRRAIERCFLKFQLSLLE